MSGSAGGAAAAAADSFAMAAGGGGRWLEAEVEFVAVARGALGAPTSR